MSVQERNLENKAVDGGHKNQIRIVLMGVVFAGVFWAFKLWFVEGGRADVPMYELSVILGITILFRGLGSILGRSIKMRKEYMCILYACLGFAIAVRGFLFPLLDIVGFTSMNVLGDSRYEIVKEAVSPLLLVHDPNALIPLYIGGTAPYWNAWIVPLIMWSLIFGALVFLYFALSSLFYDRWSEKENLSFPLIKPVAVLLNKAESDVDYSLKNKVLVLGVIVSAIAVLFFEDGLGKPPVLHHYWPVIPAFSLNFPVHNLFSPDSVLRTWLEGTWFRVNPLWIGFAFFSSTDFLFTFWVFFIVNKLSLVTISHMGGNWWTARQFTESQFIGGVVVIGLSMIWMNRKTLAGVIKAAFRGEAYSKEDYPMSPRLMVFGSIFALLFLMFVSTNLISIQPALFIPFLFGFILRAITLSRIRADAAIPVDYFLVPVGETVRHIFGDQAFQKSSIVGMAFIDRHTTGDLFMAGMPRIVEALKLSDDCSVKQNSMLKSLLIIVNCILHLYT
jgi:hypothetical protein